MLNNLRKGIGPHRQLARFIDQATPLTRCSKMPKQSAFTKVTKILATFDEGEGGSIFERRMAALHLRVKDREDNMREELEMKNTMQGNLKSDTTPGGRSPRTRT